MKKVAYTLMITWLIAWNANIGFAQGIIFFEGDLAAVKAKAQQDNKLIFVDAYTTWCGPCKWMAANTFPNEEVGGFYNKNFISYKFDMEKGEGIEFRKKYEVKAFPTLLYLDADGTVLHRVSSALNPKAFLELGATALDPWKRLAGLTKRYDEGEKSPEFLRDYLNALSMAMMQNEEATDVYFQSQSDKDLISEANYQLITSLVDNPFDAKFQFILNNKEAYSKIVDEKQLDQMIYAKFQRNLYMAKKQGDEVYDKKLAQLDKTTFEEKDKLTSHFALTDLAESNDWEAFAPKATEFFQKYPDPQMCNQYAWMFYEDQDIKDSELLTHALKWCEMALNIQKEYAVLDTHAALLFKSGNSAEGLRVANEAIALGEMSGQNVDGTRKLIEQYQ